MLVIYKYKCLVHKYIYSSTIKSSYEIVKLRLNGYISVKIYAKYKNVMRQRLL